MGQALTPQRMTISINSPHNKHLDEAKRHVSHILRDSLRHTPSGSDWVLYDLECPLARLLQECYGDLLPEAQSEPFDPLSLDWTISQLLSLPAGSLVVLIQSTRFDTKTFRLRMLLFRHGLKVIEHPHLGRMVGQEIGRYVRALEYDTEYLHSLGHALKRRIDTCSSAQILCAGHELLISAPLEPAKLNIGDYAGLEHVGGQFPIGEVFTEARDLEALNGSLLLAHFGDTNFQVQTPQRPIELIIEQGRVVGSQFDDPIFASIISEIQEREGQVWVRELGFGLNRALDVNHVVKDIGTFERMCGMHLSLGAKHHSYKKPQINKRRAHFHVDVFPATRTVYLDDEIVFSDGSWVITGSRQE